METIWSSERSGIIIEDKYGLDFISKTKRDLDRINSKMIGRELLKILSLRNQGIGTRSGNKVIIHKGTGTLTYQQSTGLGTEERRSANTGRRIRLPGSGRGSNVLYDPSYGSGYTKSVGITTPAYVALAHELIHALHVISGDVIKSYSWKNGTANSSCGAILEEARTVGCGAYQRIYISENAIRREHGLPLRKYYGSIGDCDNVSINRASNTGRLPDGLPFGHSNWVNKTSRKGHWRSKDLKAVDEALQTYCDNSTSKNLENFKKSFKHWYRRNPKEATKRNVENCVEKLRGFVLSR